MNEHGNHELISIADSEKEMLLDLERISINPRGEPLTWGATPLISTPEVAEQQFLVKQNIEDLFKTENSPEYVSDHLAEYIDILNMSRTANRENKNRASFIYREKMDLDGVPLEALEVLNRSLTGHASPAELLFVQQLLGVPSIEVASLTHPYGERIEHLQEMRLAVNEAIELLGGYTVKDIPPVFEVKGSDNPHNTSRIEGVHITRKTIFGYLESGAEICERSSAVIMLDKIDPKLARKVRAIPYKNNEAWAKHVAGACGLETLVPKLLHDDEHEKAIPVCTTVLSVDSRLEELLLSEESQQKRQLQHYMGMQASRI